MLTELCRALTAAIAVAAGSLGGAVTASAGTAVVANGGMVWATSPSVRFVVNNSIPTNCSNSGVNATVGDGTSTGSPALVSTNIQLSIGIASTPCIFPFGPLYVACSNSAGLGMTGNTAGGMTMGRLTNVNCVFSLPAIPCSASLTGTLDAAYNNAGTLTVGGAYPQSLTLSSSSCPALIPNGSAKFGGPGAGPLGLTSLTYTLNNAGGFVRPQIVASGF